MYNKIIKPCVQDCFSDAVSGSLEKAKNQGVEITEELIKKILMEMKKDPAYAGISACEMLDMKKTFMEKNGLPTDEIRALQRQFPKGNFNLKKFIANFQAGLSQQIAKRAEEDARKKQEARENAEILRLEEES